MKKTFTLLLVMISSINCFSQFSKIHYIPPITADSYGSSTKIDKIQYIYISTPNTTAVKVTVTPIGGTPYVIPGGVTNSTPGVYQITVPAAAADGSDSQLFVPQALTGAVQSNRGYLIEADDLVYANLRVGANGSQAGGLVAKGTSAYGTEFRIGGMENKTTLTGGNGAAIMNFASFVATEDNTTVTITLSNPLAINTTMTNGVKYTAPITVKLNKNQSYVMAIENASDTTWESNYMLGGLIKSDRKIVVNCGSIAGSSQIKGEVIAGNVTPYNNAGKDFGFDQIVPFDKTGSEYIFVGGYGITAKYYDLERSIIIANVDGTQVFKDGTTLVATLNAGQYYVFNGSQYTNGTLYVTTSQNVFAYQCIAGQPSSASNAAGNQNMFFVPPLNCATPSVVNNIPYIEQIGPVIYTPTVNIVTESTATVFVNGVKLTGLNATKTAVIGKTNPSFSRYTYLAPTGNVAIVSSQQVYVSYYGSNANATYGSYYSGFDIKPNLASTSSLTGTNCISNTVLSVSSAAVTDVFQWYFNTTSDFTSPTSSKILITGATTSTYTPTSIGAGGFGPGYYAVSKPITGCSNIISDPIAVSQCPLDIDNDGINNNIDIDNDNDGITNLNESFGNKGIDLTASSGTVTAGSGAIAYSNAYTGAATGAGFIGSANGSFISNLTPGSTNTYNLNFTKPISLGLTYNPAGSTAVSLSNEVFEIKSDIGSTITIINPSNQLLFDTNNDGIYESGVISFTSFDIKFQLNSSVLLPAVGPAPAVNFTIQTYMANSISFTHQNLSSTLPNTASFNFIATSIPKDTDGDGTPDQLSADSDHDGILDIAEGQAGNKTIATPFVDVNQNGLADNFEPIVAPIDTDGDGIPDFQDLDSDNDGILDSVENGTIAIAAGTPADPDTDGIKNYRDLDSDGDTCFDVAEAGFADPDTDGKLGTSPVTVDASGKVQGGTYAAPNGNYLASAAAPTKALLNTPNTDCSAKKATLTVDDDTVGPYTYKWEISTDGGVNWTTVVDNATITGSTTNTLTITNITTNGYQYRVGLSKIVSACRSLLSNVQTVNLSGAPVAHDITLNQCDSDANTMDGISSFNLTTPAVQSAISTNYINETITYYKSQAGAGNKDVTDLIPSASYSAYSNTTSPNQIIIYARVENAAGCSTTSAVTLNVGVNTSNGFVAPAGPLPVCDDAPLDKDGITTFDLTATQTTYKALFPSTGYTVDFYPTQADATAQTNVITNLASYRNTTPTTQPIWTRVNNTAAAFSGCSSIGTYFSLNVEALPVANTVTIPRQCDDNHDGILVFNNTLESTLLGTQNPTTVTVTYFDAATNPLKDADGNLITSPFPTNFKTTSQTITAVITNKTAQKCSSQTTITFTVDPSPTVTDTTVPNCDTDLDGFASFDLTTTAVKSSISTNYANETFQYYISPTGAQNATAADLISTPTNYTNSTKFSSDVWARVISSNNCASVAKVTLNVIVAFPANYNIPTTPKCDDDRDGITTFDISATKTTMEGLLPPTGYTITYYRNQADATNQANAITNLTNYQNIGYPNQQDIYVRVDNTINPSCFSTGKYITLNVEALPFAYPVTIARQCDDDTDGKFPFDTSNVQSQLIKTQDPSTIIITYFDETGNALPNPLPNPFLTASQTIKAVITNNTPQACPDQTLISFNVDVRPVANHVNTVLPFVECEDAADPLKQDGKLSFDTSLLETTLTTQSGMVVTYLDAAKNPLKDANGVLITSPFPNNFTTTSQTITAVVTNPLNPSCPASDLITFTVNPLPKIDINIDGADNEIICANNPGMTFNLDASLQDGTSPTLYSYQWSKDGTDLPGETNYTLNAVNTEGVYAVTVSTIATSCLATRTIIVTASEQAGNDTAVYTTDLTEENTITINATGRGNYAYSLDDDIGNYQDSNVFSNVSPGTHNVYIKDKNGCGILPKTVAIIGVPKFFTPNSDGYNDYWNIKGIDPSTSYTIFIYDRYGKLLKELIPVSTQGWDGIFNGSPLPSDDYWYTLKLDNGRDAKGHFSLKR